MGGSTPYRPRSCERWYIIVLTLDAVEKVKRKYGYHSRWERKIEEENSNSFIQRRYHHLDTIIETGVNKYNFGLSSRSLSSRFFIRESAYHKHYPR